MNLNHTHFIFTEPIAMSTPLYSSMPVLKHWLFVVWGELSLNIWQSFHHFLLWTNQENKVHTQYCPGANVEEITCYGILLLSM